MESAQAFFGAMGLLLFSLRNGAPRRDSKSYAEKIMIVDEEQVTPLHFHWFDADEGLAAEPMSARGDGISRAPEPGGKVVPGPGKSICLERGVYDCFYGEAGAGRVLVDEVSSVNDDAADNRFYEGNGRFHRVDEDAEPLHLLLADYADFL